MEKLSSGYAINRAGDDAAGLAVSEKMRSQIAGMKQGVKNAQAGISMVQTYEGALTETDSILQRMKTLADQMANGSYDNEVDRSAAQLEFSQLNDELNQIADTDYNGVIVLNGGRMADGTEVTNTSSLPTVGKTNANSTDELFPYSSAGSSKITWNEAGTFASSFTFKGQQIDLKDADGTTAAAANKTIDGVNAAIEVTTGIADNDGDGKADAGEFTVTSDYTSEACNVTVGGINMKSKLVLDGKTYYSTKDAGSAWDANTTYDSEGKTLTLANIKTRLEDSEGDGYSAAVTFGAVSGLNVVGTYTLPAYKLEDKDITVSEPNKYKNATRNLTYTDSITLQVGARSKDAVNFTFEYTSDGIGKLNADMDCSARGLGTDQLNLNTQGDANFAIDQIDNAINKVSMVRATFGAVQNRLEHKIDNLNVSVENLTDAESKIRDTNVAEEMANFTKNQILSQASQSMLAQANSLPQSVLQLLG